MARINSGLFTKSASCTINILDIFGFEDFAHNTFEQVKPQLACFFFDSLFNFYCLPFNFQFLIFNFLILFHICFLICFPPPICCSFASTTPTKSCIRCSWTPFSRQNRFSRVSHIPPSFPPPPPPPLLPLRAVVHFFHLMLLSHIPQEEYRREGLAFKRVEFVNNDATLALLDGNGGILRTLEDVCRYY